MIQCFLEVMMILASLMRKNWERGNYLHIVNACIYSASTIFTVIKSQMKKILGGVGVKRKVEKD